MPPPVFLFLCSAVFFIPCACTPLLNRGWPTVEGRLSVLKAVRLFLIVFILVLLSGCGRKVKVVSSWVDPSLHQYVAKDVLVIGLSRSEASLKLWENVFVDNLSGIGVHAMAGHKVIGPVPDPDRKAVEAAVVKAKAASVLITHVVDTTTRTYTHPGTIHFEPGGLYQGMYGYYGQTYRAVYTPPVDSTRTVVRLESNLYDVATARLVWSAQSEALNPNLLRTDFDRVIGTLMADMRKSGILLKP